MTSTVVGSDPGAGSSDLRTKIFGLRVQRVLIMVFALLATSYTVALVVLMDFWPPPLPSMDAQSVVALYSRDNFSLRIGIVVMILAGAFYVPFSIVVSAQMAKLERGYPVLSVVQLCCGILGTWGFAFAPALWGVAAFDVERNIEITTMLHQMGWLVLIAFAPFFAMQTISIVAISLTSTPSAYTAFPRWLGYTTAVMGTVGTIAVLAFVYQTGPFAWNGLVSLYMPVVAFAIWLSSLVFCLNRAIGAQMDECRRA